MKIIAIGHTVSELLSLTRKHHQKNVQIVAYTTKNFMDPMSLLEQKVEHEPTVTPYSAVWLKNKFDITIIPAHKIMMVHGLKKFIRVQNMYTKEILEDSYDHLSIAKNITLSVD